MAEETILRFDVYGRVMGVLRADGAWRVVYFGADGKHREAHDVVIPPSVTTSELAGYLANLFHESASPENPDVVRLDP